MFRVEITEDAKLLLRAELKKEAGPRPGIMIHRRSVVADITRTADGEALWAVERPHPWQITIGSYETIPDSASEVVMVEDFRIWLPLIPRPGESGIIVSVREDKLFVDALPA